MALLKWYDGEYWQALVKGAFDNVKLYLKNDIVALNNMAAAIKTRCRRNKNLSDISDAAAGRTNLGLINDCSSLPKAPHHHDSRYIPRINNLRTQRQNGDATIQARINALKARIDAFHNCTCKPAAPKPKPTVKPKPKTEELKDTWGYVGDGHANPGEQFVKFRMPKGVTRALISNRDAYGHANPWLVRVTKPGEMYVLETVSPYSNNAGSSIYANLYFGCQVRLRPVKDTSVKPISEEYWCKWGPYCIFGKWLERKDKNGKYVFNKFGRLGDDADSTMNPEQSYGKHANKSLATLAKQTGGKVYSADKRSDWGKYK